VTGSGPAPARGPADRSRGDYQRPNTASRGTASRQAEGSGRGTVKWFNSTKGFDFIAPKFNREDVFVHISAVERAGLRDLHEGEVVSFDLERDSRSGKLAVSNLRLDD
jgi:CspA family cold shock protein